MSKLVKSVQKLDNINDMINKTMCAKAETAESPSYHRKECVNRECDRCGVTPFNACYAG